jgi:hypothetical protein
MPGPIVANPIPDWLKPENASVTDSALTKAMRMIGHLIGADNPTSQVLGLMMSDVPSSGEAGGLSKAVAGLKDRVIKAYHGSPHDFERFSLEKIGTGEGAQAYGHGLYFAENPAVAEEYKRQLQEFTLPSLTSDENMSLDPLIRRSISGSPEQSMQALRGMEGNAYYDRARSAVQKHLAAGAPEGKTTSKMYEVAIHADPEDFLDYDKPISQQGPVIREKVSKAMDLAKEKGKSIAEYHELIGTPHGSQSLKEAGIPGIKYLDQGSRAAGEGSRNYVVFDDRLIDILKKYGLLLPAAGAATEGQTIISPKGPQ